jgi:hypothetical protein
VQRCHWIHLFCRTPSYVLFVKFDLPCGYLHSFGALFEEWTVIQWAKVEQAKLAWLRHNQGALRADVYQDIVSQATQGTTQGSQVGRRVVLPSTFTGGPRYMNELYHDGMAIVRKLGKADLFLTFTAN